MKDQRSPEKQMAEQAREQASPFLEVTVKISARFKQPSPTEKVILFSQRLIAELAKDDSWYDQVVISAGLSTQLWITRTVGGVLLNRDGKTVREGGVVRAVRAELDLRKKPDIPQTIAKMRKHLEEVAAKPVTQGEIIHGD